MARARRQGSQVQADRLRVDFNLPRGMSDEEVARVEALVNGWVAADHALTTRTVPLAEARAAGACPLPRRPPPLALWRLGRCAHCLFVEPEHIGPLTEASTACAAPRSPH